MEKRVLIGACGGLTGSYLARQLAKKGNYYLVGSDASLHHASSRFMDRNIRLPSAAAPDFCDCLIDALKQHKIDYYIPTHSQEIKAVAKYESCIRQEWNGDFLVSPIETFEKLDDKRLANACLSEIGLPVPKIVTLDQSTITYPVFMKPNTGSGSKNAQTVESVILHREYARLYPDCSFYELIKGTEYTVDCMFDDTGRLLGYNQRVRQKSMGGAVIVSQNNYNFDILPYLKKLEAAFTIKGCVNFQYILSNGIPYFIDVNLRYASGGLPLTVASGIDVLQIMLDIWQKKELPAIESCSAPGRTMYRYFEEWYEDNVE